MAARDASLSPLAVGAIFFVVFLLVFEAAPLAETTLFATEEPTETEAALADAVHATLNEAREARGLDPAPSDRFTAGTAHDTAATLLASAPANATAAAAADGPLPNHRLECAQVAVGVSARGAPDSAATARAVADAFAATDRGPVFDRPVDRFRAGVGVAVDGDRVVAVYRSCEQVDT